MNTSKGTWPDIDVIEREVALEEAEEELASLVGLAKVKRRVKQLLGNLKTQHARRKVGLKPHNATLHTVLVGPPGTGKTTLARIFGKMYYGSGLLPKPDFFEINRSDLVAEYIGQTEAKTNRLLEKAVGGTAFIDEAYGLAKPACDKDFGQDVVNLLMAHLENHRHDSAVIFAGYQDDMDRLLLASNRGFRGRIGLRFEIPDYSPHDLCQIADVMARDAEYILSPRAKGRLALLLHVAWAKRDENFENGRFVRNVLDGIALLHGSRLEGKGDRDALGAIGEDDIPIDEFSPDFDVRAINLDDLVWRITTCCGTAAHFEIAALGADNRCKCGRPMELPWGSIDFSTAGPAFEQIMKKAGARFTPAQAEVFKPRPKRPHEEKKAPRSSQPSKPIESRTNTQPKPATPIVPSLQNAPPTTPAPTPPSYLVTPPSPPAPASPPAPITPTKIGGFWQIMRWMLLLPFIGPWRASKWCAESANRLSEKHYKDLRDTLAASEQTLANRLPREVSTALFAVSWSSLKLASYGCLVLCAALPIFTIWSILAAGTLALYILGFIGSNASAICSGCG